MFNNLVKNSNPHILVVDDKPEELHKLLSLLSQQRWTISLSIDAHAGYQRAVALCPDLIILDVVMPRMNGFAMCRLLRETASTRNTPVIFLTSTGMLEERLEAFELGGVDYILKPFAAQEVLARINVHLRLNRYANVRPQINIQNDEACGDQNLDTEQIILQAAMNFIWANLSETPSLPELAQAVGTHAKRLSGIFRQQIGMTVFDYVRQIRLQKAQELLIGSKMSIQDISELTGFQSPCNFTTSFRRAKGLAPSEFRKKTINIK